MSSNPAQPGAGVALCPVDAVKEPGAKGFVFRSGEALFMGFVVRKGGQVKGWIDRCPHTGFPLALLPDRYFTSEGDLLLCSSHGALFRPLDGFCVGGPCAGRSLYDWPVAVEDGMIVTA
jgi:nitrite reductase/ring-hydroxylating ferredoxin subunit